MEKTFVAVSLVLPVVLMEGTALFLDIGHNCSVFLLVLINPPVFISEPGGSAVFLCFDPIYDSDNPTISVHWLLNGTLLENINLTSTSVQTEVSDRGTGAITLSNIFEGLNETMLDCMLELQTGSVKNSSITSILLIQGEFTS